MTDASQATPETLISPAVLELIALAAAMAANSDGAFQVHNARLEKLGVSREDRIQAVNIAIQVKMAPHRDLMELAEGFLMGGAAKGGCCGGGCGEDEECCGGGDACTCDDGCNC